MPELILASTSRYRRELLLRLGVPFRCVAPHCDEEQLKDSYGAVPPQILAERLAEAKAASVAAEYPAATVIGSDQVAEVDGVILGKPGTAAAALAQLQCLRGREHRLITALAIATPGGWRRHTDVTRLTMHPLDDAALTRYVAADSPLDCAGSYKLECRGIALFSAISSADHSAITGLPLLVLAGQLRELGFAIP